MFFHANLRFLRKRKRLSQMALAEELAITRSSLNNYENGNVQPRLETLLKLSECFSLPVDFLLRLDLSKFPELEIRRMEQDTEAGHLAGSHLRILATTVDSRQNENIELVPVKAKAGYANGYADPEFIAALPKYRLPFLDNSKTYRTFQIEGDSMPPVPHGSWVTGEYLDDWNAIKDGKRYLVVTVEDGVVFKRVYSQIEESRSLLLCSDNPDYKPYNLPVKDVLEVWGFVHFVGG